MISIVLCEYKIGSHYVKEHRFYSVDIRNISFKEDDRFRSIYNKRKECALLGVVNNLSFPVHYPIYLENGNVIDKIN